VQSVVKFIRLLQVGAIC